MENKQVILKPHLSEKAYGLSEKLNTYTLIVPAGSNKHSVARAISAQFEVSVIGVRLTNIHGKAKRTVSQKGRRVQPGRTINAKKAYVTLKAGDSLPLFKNIKEAEEKQQATQEKFTKAIEKQAKKETKPARSGLRRFVNRRGEV